VVGFEAEVGVGTGVIAGVELVGVGVGIGVMAGDLGVGREVGRGVMFEDVVEVTICIK